ncbi:MAG: gliding motility-associated C-terminal domain-containing protein [Flavobacteriales bacterium]|jgi:gliding motility-associated-like protein
MRVLIVLIPVFVAGLSSAQLVNGGFETCSAFPSNTGQWQVVQGWNNAASLVASPDYYHYAGSAAADLPETPLAIVEAWDGEAVMGLIACGRQHTNLREYLTSVFSEPLKVGDRYRFSFRISNGDRTFFSTAGLAVKGIGVHFSTIQPVQEAQLPLNLSPQWMIPEVLYSSEWVTYTFTFEADQPYLYASLGLFGDDTDKEILIVEGDDPVYAYYFFDGVALNHIPEDGRPTENPIDREPVAGPEPIYSPEPFFVPNSFTPNGDGYNDEFKPVAGSVSEWEFSVFDRWGERVFYTTDETLGWNGWYNSKKADSGTYAWSVLFRVYDNENGWIQKEEHGVVTLLR